jgi:type I restriction enzyme, R subunit
MRPIRSMIEFKQIIGRGPRTFDGKDFFTIWDFVKAHENFEDPEWDGEPLEPEPPKEPRLNAATGGEEPGGEPLPNPGEGGDGEENAEKIVVKLADGKERTIRFIATTTYWSADGKPISAAEFLNRLFGDLSGIITDEDELRRIWSDPDNRERFLTQLAEAGYDRDRLDEIRHLVDAPKSDLFDVLAYVLFTSDPKTRRDRAERLRQDRMEDFQGELRQLLLGILSAYESVGEEELASKKLTQFLTARYGSVSEGMSRLGDLMSVRDAYKQMQANLYRE